MDRLHDRDGFCDFDSTNAIDTSDDHVNWGDMLTSTNSTRDPCMDWRDSHNTDQSYHATHADSAGQGFPSDLSLLSQGTPFSPEYSSDSLQNTFTTNDQGEEDLEDTNEPEDGGAANTTRPFKTDRRGSHWKEKERQGGACPQPWQGNKDWAGKVRTGNLH